MCKLVRIRLVPGMVLLALAVGSSTRASRNRLGAFEQQTNGGDAQLGGGGEFDAAFQGRHLQTNARPT